MGEQGARAVIDRGGDSEPGSARLTISASCSRSSIARSANVNVRDCDAPPPASPNDVAVEEDAAALDRALPAPWRNSVVNDRPDALPGQLHFTSGTRSALAGAAARPAARAAAARAIGLYLIRSPRRGKAFAAHCDLPESQPPLAAGDQSAGQSRECIPPSAGFRLYGLARRGRTWQAACPTRRHLPRRERREKPLESGVPQQNREALNVATRRLFEGTARSLSLEEALMKSHPCRKRRSRPRLDVLSFLQRALRSHFALSTPAPSRRTSSATPTVASRPRLAFRQACRRPRRSRSPSKG